MKPYSLTRRLVVTVLLVELLLAIAATGLALLYERQHNLHAFDLMLRGRADSLLGAVKDAEDVDDNVMLDPKALDLRPGDMYEVRNESGRVIGSSPNWKGEIERKLTEREKAHNFRLDGKKYRGFVLHGVRQIDQGDKSPGTARPVIIFYASSLKPFWVAMSHAAKFLVISNLLILLFTAGTLLILLRRGMAPLEELAGAAAAISSNSLRFRAPPNTFAVQELAVVARALESAMSRLERAFVQQQIFVHDAAHELKTSVTIIKSSLQLLTSRKRTAAEYERGLEMCLSDCARLEDLVQKLLILARVEQPQDAQATPAKTDVSECLREVADQMEPVASVRGVKLVVDLQRRVIARIASDDCATLATNLVVNALQHTPAGGTVLLQVLFQDGTAGFRVKDNGEGIAAGDLPKIFDRFYRGDPSRSRNTGGAGLGLAICKALAEGAGGEIKITSDLGRGTVAEVTLPGREEDRIAPPLQEILSNR
ncbi:MAG TPA: ATP-binding protein [Acidobacteriaceae bacterium]|nr:ATP-binding protein [Acidobacteriaceae bacterium]